MQETYSKIVNLFLQQSYQESWEYYVESLKRRNFICWDYIILTASNEEQADVYRQQLNLRIQQKCLPENTHYAVIPDPDGKRIGSGGATFQVMRYIGEKEQKRANPFKNLRIMVIHSGGDSKRIPQYSAVGKLFSPVPRELPDGRASTLFDEIIIGMSAVPFRIKEGMLILSGDVLLLFNPFQIDFQFNGAAAISAKANVNMGKNHGVFLKNNRGTVRKFLHKQTEKVLREQGAVDEQDCIDLDTGLVILDGDLVGALYSLITDNWEIVEEQYDRFVNEDTRLNFYGDFLYPLAEESTPEDYYEEPAEGNINSRLLYCREKIWNVLHPFRLKVMCVSPAEFIHFGTTREMWELFTLNIQDYKFLDWKKQVISTSDDVKYSCRNSYVEQGGVIQKNAYVEDSYILENSSIGENSIVSNLCLVNHHIPSNVVLHGLCLKNGGYVARIYCMDDNPKNTIDENVFFLGEDLRKSMDLNGIQIEDIWNTGDCTLWDAALYPVCDTVDDAVSSALLLYRMVKGKAEAREVEVWKQRKRVSLASSFNEADTQKIFEHKRELTNYILSKKFVDRLERGCFYQEAFRVFGNRGITEPIFDILMKTAERAKLFTKIRVYYALSCFMKEHGITYKGIYDTTLEKLCFSCMQQTVYNETRQMFLDNSFCKIEKNEVTINLPLRVNWAGGWSDTPPYCNENGGTVLNVAIKINGYYPVQVTLRKLPDLCVQFESEDIGIKSTVTNVKELQNCANPYDGFAIHKAALIACGVIPLNEDAVLEKILEKIGGGIYLSTQVLGVPKGSGLGTSSILAAACVKGIYNFFGMNISEEKICEIVLCMEQLMSTGGGWQDQVGGLTAGIKFITSAPGIVQKLNIQKIILNTKAQRELQNRFILIYTGQRRLARNLLRKVVGNYIGGRPETVSILREIQQIAILMKFELEKGDITAFAKLLNRHWELSQKLEPGITNTCIDQIVLSIEDMVDGVFIAGAGGGGFLQAILKKGITKAQVQKRVYSIFKRSEVKIWDCELLL